jgi:hypothetical protein
LLFVFQNPQKSVWHTNLCSRNYLVSSRRKHLPSAEPVDKGSTARMVKFFHNSTLLRMALFNKLYGLAASHVINRSRPRLSTDTHKKMVPKSLKSSSTRHLGTYLVFFKRKHYKAPEQNRWSFTFRTSTFCAFTLLRRLCGPR